jgi:hypothetical protein
LQNEDADKALAQRGDLSGVKTYTEPKVGLSPVEFWEGRYHVGSPITETYFSKLPEQQDAEADKPASPDRIRGRGSFSTYRT